MNVSILRRWIAVMLLADLAVLLTALNSQGGHATFKFWVTTAVGVSCVTAVVTLVGILCAVFAGAGRKQ